MRDTSDDARKADATGGTTPSSSASLYQLSLTGGCPRCAEPTLFAGMLSFAPTCSNCGLDFDSFNVGDGPAAFLTFGIGTLVTLFGIILELTVEPAWWVHVLIWPPVTILAVIGSLRIAKATLLAIEYRNSAREGRHRSEP